MKRKSSVFVLLILIFSFLTACVSTPKYPRGVDDSTFRVISLKDVVIGFMSVGQTVTDIKKMENFAGDPYYLVSGTDESGIKFEIALHGWSGFFMFGESNVYKTRFENYSDKTGTLISGSSTGVLLYESGGVYFDVLTGKSVDLLRIEELKKQSAENDHNMFVDSYINVREKLDMKTIEEDIAFLIGYTVTA